MFNKGDFLILFLGGVNGTMDYLTVSVQGLVEMYVEDELGKSESTKVLNELYRINNN